MDEREQQLIQLIRDGNRQAWGELIQIHQDRLYTSMVRVVGNPERARDVVQDTFIQAIEKFSRFDGKSKFFTWLYRIAFNRAMTLFRKDRGELSLDPLTSEEREDSLAGRQTPPENGVMQRELVAEVQQALQQLSPEHRAVMELREIQQCEYEEIATILDISLGTVRSRLYRAREQLRRLLRDYFDQESSGDAGHTS